MAFDVYPASLISPLTVAAGGTSAAVPFTERADPVTTPNMVIRLVMIGDGLAPPGGPDPAVLLTAGTGAEVTLPADSVFYTIYNTPGTSSQVADARLVPEARNVYKLEVYLYATGSAWQLKIRNNAAVARDFIWVVASTDGEARQPWMHVTPAAVTLTALTNQTLTQALQITNKGTGNLTVTNPPASPVGGGFSTTTVPAAIEPNATATMGLSFLSAAPGASAGVVLDVTGDTTAQVGGGHNRRVTLNATTGKIEVGFMIDGSGSMEARPDGQHPAPLAESRWAKLKMSLKECLDLFQFFGENLGRFAVGVFPNITVPGAPPPSSGDLQPPSNITGAAISTAKNSLDAHNPVWAWTPIGKGLERALGSTPATFGYFEGGLNSVTYNRRVLVLMSDGAHNLDPPHPNAFLPPTAAAGMAFGDKRVRCLTVGYGDPASPTVWEVDHVLLNEIGTKSGGLFYFSGTNNDGLDLAKVLRAVLTEGLSLNPIVDPPVTLSVSRPELRREVTIVPYDTKASFVVDWATDGRPVQVTLITPLCEVITATSVPVGAVFKGHPRYQIFSFDFAFLRNAANPAMPRFGTWKLIVSASGLTTPERIDYEVITESRLRLAVTADRTRFYAGDAFRFDARLTLDGLPLRNATVTLTVRRPGESVDKILAYTWVTQAELTRAAQRYAGRELTRKGLRIAALNDKGVRLGGFWRPEIISMVDTSGTGVYSATVSDTSTPGAYDLWVIATGETPDGVAFRREQRLHALVEVRPHPDFTVVSTRFVKQLDVITAVVTVFPRDPIGNPLIVEPTLVSDFDISVKGAEPLTPIEHTADGSYTRTIRYDVNAKPTIRIAAGGVELAQRLQLPPVATLQYVDEVLEFTKGGEGKKGANKHTAAKDVLGDVTTKKPDRFLALGDRGSVVVGIKNKLIRHEGKEDVTVFTSTEDGLRPYRVDALASGRGEKWVKLGESAGGTATFSLGRLQSAKAIRITDEGGSARNTDLSISNAPGLRILGVGIASATR